MDDATSVADLASDPTAPLTPMEAAERIVNLTREQKQLEAEVDDIKDRIKALNAELLTAIEDGDFPAKSSVAGATVFTRHDLRANAARNEDGKTDHDELSRWLAHYGHDELLPSTVNSQRLTSWIKELIRDAPPFDGDGNPLTPEQRLAHALHDQPELVKAISVSVTPKVIVNGA